MGKALRLLNLQKDIRDYELLIDNYDSNDRRPSLFDLIYPRKNRERTHLSFLRQINSNPCLICLSTCLSPRQPTAPRGNICQYRGRRHFQPDNETGHLANYSEFTCWGQRHSHRNCYGPNYNRRYYKHCIQQQQHDRSRSRQQHRLQPVDASHHYYHQYR
jgi:hypothetical protein